jgi:hypothetical protein
MTAKSGEAAKKPEGLKKKELKRFRELLEEKRNELLTNARRTLDQDMTIDSDDLPDEMDLASSEYLQSFTFRLRGREKTFLSKIEHALSRPPSPGIARRATVRRGSASRFRPRQPREGSFCRAAGLR